MIKGIQGLSSSGLKFQPWSTYTIPTGLLPRFQRVQVCSDFWAFAHTVPLIWQTLPISSTLTGLTNLSSRLSSRVRKSCPGQSQLAPCGAPGSQTALWRCCCLKCIKSRNWLCSLRCPWHLHRAWLSRLSGHSLNHRMKA